MKQILAILLLTLSHSTLSQNQQLEKVSRGAVTFKVMHFCHDNSQLRTSSEGKNLFLSNKCTGQFLPQVETKCLTKRFELECPQGKKSFLAAVTQDNCLPKSLIAKEILTISGLSKIKRLCPRMKIH